MTRFDLSRVAVGGLGLTGRALTEALIARGHHVVVADDRPEAVVEAASELAVEIVDATSEEELENLLSRVDTVVPSPGIPRHHKLLRLADDKEIAVLSELDVGSLWDHRPRIAVTGTNGKTTVTELTTKILNNSEVKAAAIGNTEVSFVAALADQPEKNDVFVVEASSFALDRVQHFRAQSAAWLNLSPDHLDWHGDFESYAAAKAKVFHGQGSNDFAIVPHELGALAPWLPKLEAQRITFGMSAGDVHCTRSELTAHGEKVIDIGDLLLSRPHDLLNACAAVALGLSMGASIHGAEEALAGFQGLPHRMELLVTNTEIRFFNDSKATTPHATVAGISGLDAVVLIAGGRNKGLDLRELASIKSQLRAVVAIGDASEDVIEILGKDLPTTIANSMEEAVSQAFQYAVRFQADVVLSPACASFDWYSNYVERGDDFKRIVDELTQERRAT